ncbi:PAX3- and PAX7-binding protein 1 [Paramormyrops kingsleyae]|uniref:PAX3- and PAX7-binding protein 1 n=1 Tax=Paramormyrops kingsleyae TaxID=1676925 RepID=UPI000CD5C9FE|nr:PAX3- and PAX7-binding protein 1 [Paramormyrops kingsleyae]
MFKKAKRVNFRRRNESDDDEKEDGREPQIATPPVPQQPCGPAVEEGSIRDPDAHNSEAVPGGTVTVHHGNGLQLSVGKAVKEKKKNNKDGRDAPRASLLSFHDDEEDTEVFRVKKPNHSKKIVKQLKKEYKEDLEKNSTIRQETTASTDETVAPTLVTVKEEPKAEGSRASSEQGEEEMEVDSNEEPDEDGEPRGGAGAAFSNTLSSLSTLRPGEIPDAAFIHAARKRRQLARELGADGPAPEPEGGKKRLVREDEHDGSDDDEDEKRIVFSGVKMKTQRQKIAEEIGIEGSDDEALDTAGNDEEVSRWEQEQIRKGISIPQVQTNPPEDANMYYQSGYDVQPYGTSYSLTYSYNSVAGDDSKAKADTSVTFSAPSSDLTPITTDLVKKRLKDRLSSVRQGHSSNAKRYEQIQEELASSARTIQRLEGSSDAVADQYKFLQEMRGYVRDLLECFGEKVPVILELEAAMHQLLMQRASRLVQRRQDDIKDESAEFSSLSNKALMAPNLDSFGRDRAAYQEHAKQRRIAEREARRTRRRQAREQNGKRAAHREGLSSDDEETSTDITSFNLERERILKDSKKVFEDVLEDFQSLDGIKSRFEVWRKLYSACYQDAYIGLCLPKLFSPLVRLQLIGWFPLEVDCPNFEYMLWFESLLFYNCEEQSEMQKDDVDVGLLPAIVEKVILPKLAVLVDQVWDPLSSNQTSRLVAFMQRLIKGYPTVLHGDNRNTQELLKTIVLRTRRTLDNDIFMPLFPKNILENKNSGPYLFFQRQFWSCVKLLENILQWYGILSNCTLRELAVDSTLNRYILSALQSTDPGEESIDKSRSVVECFPQQWFSSLKGQQTIPQLENFCRYLKHVASTVYRISLAGSDMERRNAREQIKEVVKLLGRINALDHVVAVATEHGIKDIKTLLESK